MDPEIPEIRDCSEFVSHFLPAAKEALAAIITESRNGIRVRSGSLVRREADGSYTYSFIACSTFRLNPGEKVSLLLEERNYPCLVRETEGMTIVLNSVTYFGPQVSMATITEDSVAGLIEVIHWMEAGMPAENPEILDALVSASGRQDLLSDEFDTSQQMAVDKTVSLPVSFIWGLPGTGKTTTVGKAVLRLLGQGRRVLLLSMANVAVDEAILKIQPKIYPKVGP